MAGVVAIGPAALTGWAIAGEPELPCAYEATTIVGPVGQFGIQAHVVILGLNDKGVGVGYYYWTAATTIACTWTETEGVKPILNVPAGVTSAEALAVNNNGWVLVNANSAFGYRGFVLEPTGDGWTWHMIVPAAERPYGAGWTFCYGINDQNEVVGTQSMGSPSDPVHPYGGFYWTVDGGRIDIQVEGWNACQCRGINNAGLIVGNVAPGVTASQSSAGVLGFVLDGLDVVFLEPPSPYVRSWCHDINNAGIVIGGAAPPSGTKCGFFYDSTLDLMTCTLPPAGYSVWQMAEVNDSGVTCGYIIPTVEGLPPPAVSNSASVQNIAPLIINVGKLDATPAWGDAINSIGQVACTAYPDSVYLLTPAVVPADLTCDAAVDADDLAVMVNAWGTPLADLDGDRVTTSSDLGLLLSAWTP